MARNQRGSCLSCRESRNGRPIMRILGDKATNVGRLSFRPASSALRSWAGGCPGVRVRTFGSPRAPLSRSELLLLMQRLAFGGIPSFLAASLSPSIWLKRLQSDRSPLCSGSPPTGAHC
jgi:hypothetical protein